MISQSNKPKKKYKYWYEIIVNGSTVVSVRNLQPRIFSNVKEYLSDPWYPAFTSDFGTVYNLKIKLGKVAIGKVGIGHKKPLSKYKT